MKHSFPVLVGVVDFLDLSIYDMVSLLSVGLVLYFCGVGELIFMVVFMKSYGAEIVVDFWHLICDVGNRRILF